MLYLISLGLYNEKDMSLRALETAKKCDILYVEFYTTKMETDVKKLSYLVNKEVKEISRKDIENRSVKILEQAAAKNVGVFVGGDALSATTHMSLLLEAKKLGIKTKVIHGSSVLTAVGETGLSLYKFGKTTTLAFPEENYKPTSCYDAILENKKMGLHTLVLLDVKPPRYMTVKEGLSVLMDIEKTKKKGLIAAKEKIIAACCLGGESIIKYGKILDLAKDPKLKKTPAVLIFPGELHFHEKEFLEGL